MESEIAPVTQAPAMMIESLSVDQAQKTFAALQSFIKTQMKKDTDFGIIPGCKKPSLYKPGAEKLLFFHGLGVKLETTSETIADWKIPFFNFCYRATVYNPRTGNVIATADGSCNSKEDKYAYRWVPEKGIPRGIKKEDLVSKSGRSKYGEYTLYRLDNTEVYGLNNTIMKMAQKRAMVAAALIACRASDIFTQDIDPEEPEEKTAAPQATEESPRVISQPQTKRLFAILKASGVEEEALAQHLKTKYSYTVDADDNEPHLSRIKLSDYDTIVTWVESQKKK